MKGFVFKFGKLFEHPNAYIPHNIGRLYLGKGEKSCIVRVVFTPDGMILAIPKDAIKNGVVVFLEDAKFEWGAI